MAIRREDLVANILKCIEQRVLWDKDTQLIDIIKSEVKKHGRNSATDRYNTNLVKELRRLYHLKHGG